jgi:hypothetical protein
MWLKPPDTFKPFCPTSFFMSRQLGWIATALVLLGITAPVVVAQLTLIEPPPSDQRPEITPELLWEMCQRKEVIRDCTINKGTALAEILTRPSGLTGDDSSIQLENVTIETNVFLPNGAANRQIKWRLECKKCLFRGGIDLSYCIFAQDLVLTESILSSLRLENDILPNLQVNKCEFEGPKGITLLDLKNVQVNRADFSENTVKGLFTVYRCTFNELFLIGGSVLGETFVAENHFNGRADFSAVHFKPDNPESPKSGAWPIEFNSNVFSDDFTMNGSGVESVRFFRNLFLRGLYCEGMWSDSAGHVKLQENTYKGRVSLAKTTIYALEFEAVDSKRGDVTFEKTVDLQGIRCAKLSISRADFLDRAEFSGSKISGVLSLDHVVFRDSVDFDGITLPTKQGVSSMQDDPKGEQGLQLVNVRFEKGIDANWKRFLEPGILPFWRELRITKCDPGTWRSLSEAFKQRSNLVGQNEAYYYQRVQARNDRDEDENQFLNLFSLIIWGYGVRPLRLLGWLAVVIAVFALFYALIGYIPDGSSSDVKGRMPYWKALLSFSARTAWSLDFGLRTRGGLVVRSAAFFQSVLCKIMMICLLQAFANVSPLIHEILGKFIEF